MDILFIILWALGGAIGITPWAEIVKVKRKNEKWLLLLQAAGMATTLAITYASYAEYITT